MNTLRGRLPNWAGQPVIFVKWLVFACLIGLVCGGVGTLFHFAIDAAAELRAEHHWILWLLPVGGALIVLLYRWCGMEKDPGHQLRTGGRAGERTPPPAHRAPYLRRHRHHPSGGRFLRP